LFASGNRTANIARARELLAVAPPIVEDEERKPAAPDEPRVLPLPLPTLRRPHDRHRDLRTRLRAYVSANACSDADQD
jgi:hypothetical protein